MTVELKQEYDSSSRKDVITVLVFEIKQVINRHLSKNNQSNLIINT